MFAANRNKAHKPAGQDRRNLRSAFLKQLATIAFGVRKLVRWLQDEAGRRAMWRELNLLDDRCLDDIGLRRPPDPKTDDLVKLLRAGG
jgi:uncharacterized protein YjiS (DUF1127 family)